MRMRGFSPGMTIVIPCMGSPIFLTWTNVSSRFSRQPEAITRRSPNRSMENTSMILIVVIKWKEGWELEISMAYIRNS